MTASFWGMGSNVTRFPVDATAAPAFPAAPAPNMRPDGFGVEETGVDDWGAAEEAAWRGLVAGALEPNPFFEPGFALSAARHFPRSLRPRFVALWRGATFSESQRLVALFPLAGARPMFGGGLERLWLHENAALASPLIDRRGGEAALCAFLDWLGETGPAPGVLFPKLTISGGSFALIESVAKASGRRLRTLDRYERAALFPGGEVEALWRRNSSLHAYKELNRRRRRMAEAGPVETCWSVTPEDVRRDMETFLALEAAGWKGARGALLGNPSLATFARSAARLLAREGKCRILNLDVAGKRVAMGIVLESGARASFWKIAFDESQRAVAPGIHLVHELTRAHLARNDLEFTDSCAIPDHPMIDRFWPDRIGVCDIAVETRPGQSEAFDSACNLEMMRRRARAAAKDAVYGLLKRKPS